jgi:methyl-accepting chemotaxis protein
VKKISLRNKILIPIIGLVLVVGVIAAIATSVMVTRLTDTQLERAQTAFQKNIDEKQDVIHSTYQQLKAAVEEKALEEAALFSQLPQVEAAYRLALSGNIEDEADPKGQQARDMLREEMLPHIKGFIKQTGKKQFQLHYHLPNTHSLVRLWRDGWQTKRNGKKVDISDDLSGFRESVKQVNASKKPVKGIEVGSGGFVIRGMCPVTAADGTHLGSNEVITPFLPIIDALKTSKNESFAVVMDKGLLKVATALQDPQKNPILGGNYVLCAATNFNEAAQLLESQIQLLDQGLKSRQSEMVGHYYVAAFPIEDFKGSPVGVFLSILDVSEDAAALEARRGEAGSSLHRLQLGIAVGTIFIVLLIGLVIWLITRSFIGPLNHIIDSLATGADQVNSASGQISTASQSQAEGASEQATAIEETSASLEEISSMTRQNADNATQANQLMNDVKSVVDKASVSMKQMNASMEEIYSAGQEIEKIIKTIDEIAFQTNLLALNAAVEAARAGEAGAGFAVVSDEVRNLAQRAAEAAGNTSSLIEGTIAKINQGAELVRTTDEVFTEVANSSNKAVELVDKIASASVEQAQGIDQVNSAVTQMDQVTQSTAASAEESASASEELNTQAQGMLDIVSELITLVEGSATATRLQTMHQSENNSGIDRKSLPMRREKQPSRRVPKAGLVKANEVIPMDNDFSDF